MRPSYRVACSDLSFLYNDCHCCFVRKVRDGVRRPTIPMPRVFTAIHQVRQTECLGERTERLIPELPLGKFTSAEKWVKSRPDVPPGRTAEIQVVGRFDLAVRFDGGSHGIGDIKTAFVRDVNVARYGRQLHGYAFAVENPEPGALAMPNVKHLWLDTFEVSGLVPTGLSDVEELANVAFYA